MPEVRRNDEDSRYELWGDGSVLGTAAYVDRGPRRVFTHTEIEPGHEGEGLGSALVGGALDDTRAQDRPVVPLCPFVSGWIDRHDEYGDLVDHEALRALDA